jgi:hypothetical protein
MAKTIWNAADRQALLSRFDTLQAGQKPKWGKMSASQMVRHCTVPMYAAMGEFAVTHKNTFFRIWPMQKLIIYVLPWPQGAPTAPEFIITEEGHLPDLIAGLRTAVDRFVAKGESQTFQPHAAFGPLSGADWGALMHRHLDHHLKQFGA